MLTVDCERVRSASSSYPSEGMRSPVTSSRSLEPVTSHTMNYLAEYRCYGRYPSQNMCDLSNASIREGYDAGSIVRENIQAFNIDGDTPSNRAISNSTPGPNSPSLTTSHNGGTELARCDDTDGEHEQKKLSLKSRNTAPIFENENGISSQREASFTSSQRPNTQVSSDDGHDYQAGGRNASSTDRLRLSEDTDSTIPTAVRRSSVEGGEDVWSTVHDVGEKQLSRPASWRQLFVFSASNHASDAAFSQRIQNFRLRKWAKKVGLKTKARFQLMGRPIPITAKRTNSKVRPHKWYHVKKRRRRGGNATRRLKKNSRNKKEKHWSVGKTLEATKERVKQHKKIADDFLGSLVKRKSTQLGTLKFEKESKAPVTHKRVQSCPASIINS
ncbi:hypothetical protein F5Y10DRAFT_254738 [Nemania abortiva]|nr:hypothetical protein F5Y10DRAFT_254738 [Nemania abortiva]